MIIKLYHWLWHDWLRRKEPFTVTIQEDEEAEPLVYMLIFLSLGLVVGILCRRYWWQMLIGFLTGVLVGHLWW